MFTTRLQSFAFVVAARQGPLVDSLENVSCHVVVSCVPFAMEVSVRGWPIHRHDETLSLENTERLIDYRFIDYVEHDGDV